MEDQLATLTGSLVYDIFPYFVFFIFVILILMLFLLRRDVSLQIFSILAFFLLLAFTWLVTAEEISDEDYTLIYSAIKNKSDFVEVLPNYTTENCIISVRNYSKLKELINSKELENDLKKISHKYSIEYVKKACNKTVFNEKNLAEIIK